MSTALTTSTDPAPRAVASLTGGMVAAIVPQTFDDVYRFAQVVAQSGLCPYGMDTPQKVTVAILTGLEIGVKPMQAVQGIAVIGGRPCVWGDLALGVVRGSGELEWIKEFYEGDLDSVNWSAPTQAGAALKVKAVCVVKRKGEPETRNEFSIGDAVVAKLWGKRGHNGKDTPWITNPKRMLKMRARGFGLRDQFTDVMKGLYIAEEMIGVEEERAQITGPAAPPPPPAEPSRPALAPEPPANTNAGPAAPPAEEAEIVSEPLSHSGEGAPSPAEGGGAEEHPPLAQEEPFDAEAWLEEIRDRFTEAKTTADVDDVHGMFGDTANEQLSLTDRQKYQDMHEAAVLRTATQDQPEQAEVTGEPGPAPVEAGDEEDDSIDDGSFPGNDAIAATAPPKKSEGELYIDRIRTALDDPTRTFQSVAGLWNATKEERAKLKAAGEISKEQSKELENAIKAKKAADDAPAQAGPGAPPPPAEEDEATRYDRDFRARVEACTTVEEISALSAGTLGERAKFAGNPLQETWKKAVADRRKQITGIA